jgi:hypothetical protein
VALTPCGHGSDKNRIYADMELKTKLETLQTVEETLFANRKSKEKKCSKQLTKYLYRMTNSAILK